MCGLRPLWKLALIGEARSCHSLVNVELENTSEEFKGPNY